VLDDSIILQIKSSFLNIIDGFFSSTSSDALSISGKIVNDLSHPFNTISTVQNYLMDAVNEIKVGKSLTSRIYTDLLSDGLAVIGDSLYKISTNTVMRTFYHSLEVSRTSDNLLFDEVVDFIQRNTGFIQSMFQLHFALETIEVFERSRTIMNYYRILWTDCLIDFRIKVVQMTEIFFKAHNIYVDNPLKIKFADELLRSLRNLLEYYLLHGSKYSEAMTIVTQISNINEDCSIKSCAETVRIDWADCLSSLISHAVQNGQLNWLCFYCSGSCCILPESLNITLVDAIAKELEKLSNNSDLISNPPINFCECLFVYYMYNQNLRKASLSFYLYSELLCTSGQPDLTLITKRNG
jgi:hypothetical protein